MSEQTRRPVIEKLAKILGQIKRVPKKGRNDYHKYDYVMEADLADALRDHLSAEGLALVPSVRADRTHERELTGKNGKVELLVTVTLDITIIDGESGDSITTTWQGQGTDSGDKAYYKAYTGALKYFMLKTFLVPTGDDPEIEETPVSRQRAGAVEDRAPEAPRRAPQAAPAAPPPNPGPMSDSARKLSEGEEHDALRAEFKDFTKQAKLDKDQTLRALSGFVNRYGDGAPEMGRVPLQRLREGVHHIREQVAKGHDLRDVLRDLNDWAINPVDAPVERPTPHTKA